MTTLDRYAEGSGVMLALVAISDAMLDADPEFQPGDFLRAALL
jgi:hypothetical protein